MPTPPPPTRTPRESSRQRDAAARRARRRTLVRRRLAALALVALLAGGVIAVLADGGSGRAGRASQGAATGGHGAAEVHSRPRRAVTRARPKPSAPFAVGVTVMRFIDRTRQIRRPDGATAPRTLVTYVRYPAAGAAAGTERLDAPPARSAGPFPLIVFGPGFDVTPELYARLLRAWARAGYVVAAPSFPLATPATPGGPTEADLPNQPADMSFVISQLLRASGAPSGLMRGLIFPARSPSPGNRTGATRPWPWPTTRACAIPASGPR